MDLLNDFSYAGLTKIASKVVDLPDYVRKYTPLTKESASGLPDSLFAHPVKREYPVESPAGTWLSSAYLAMNMPNEASDIAKVAKENILKAASIYGIEKDVVAAMEKVATEEEYSPELDDANFGIVEKDLDGNVTNRGYPMFDANGVCKAAVYFVENRAKYPVELRNALATKILEKAAQHGVENIAREVWLEAGMGIPNRTGIMDEILHRASLTKDAEVAAVFANINNVVANANAEDLADQLIKLAGVMETFDHLEGINNGYGRTHQLPTDVIYSMSTKEAEELFKNAVTIGNNIFKSDELAKLGSATFDNVLGDGWSKQASDDKGRLIPSKLKDALTKLTSDDSTLLEEYIVSSFS